MFFIKGVKAWKSSFHKMGIHFLSFEQQCTAGQREMLLIESVGKKETLNERFESVRVLSQLAREEMLASAMGVEERQTKLE